MGWWVADPSHCRFFGGDSRGGRFFAANIRGGSRVDIQWGHSVPSAKVRVAMDDDHAFLGAIALNPEELGPRLRYADYLEGKGDVAENTRAEFIRVQCALDRMNSDDPAFKQLRKRERAILDANWRTWMRPICLAIGEPLPIPPPKRTWSEWRKRQFRSISAREPSYWLEWGRWSSRQERIYHASSSGHEPFLGSARFIGGLVSSVSLRNSSATIHLDRLFDRSPVYELNLNSCPGAILEHIVLRGFITRLRVLHVGLNILSPQAIAEISESLHPLLQCPSANNIREFHVVIGDEPNDHQFRSLSQAVSLRPEKLEIQHNRWLEVVVGDSPGIELNEAYLDEFIASRFSQRLRHLTLVGLSLPESGFAKLLRSLTIEHLELKCVPRLDKEMIARLSSRFQQIKITLHK